MRTVMEVCTREGMDFDTILSCVVPKFEMLSADVGNVFISALIKIPLLEKPLRLKFQALQNSSLLYFKSCFLIQSNEPEAADCLKKSLFKSCIILVMDDQENVKVSAHEAFVKLASILPLAMHETHLAYVLKELIEQKHYEGCLRTALEVLVFILRHLAYARYC
jgi:hypothetical protein